MNFNDYIIDDSDYDFFSSLPTDEKLLFVYDLICDDYYGAGSTDSLISVTEEDIENELLRDIPDDSVFETYDPKLREAISNSISGTADVNILILNNKLILNSDSETLLNDTVQNMMRDGVILHRLAVTKEAMENFHLLKFCKLFTIVGKEEAFSKN
jgi:hypothetical protein